MFQNKISCPSCHERIDAFDQVCPHCHSQNSEYDKTKLSRNAFNVSFVWQLVIFATGWIGLQIIASVIQVGFIVFGRVEIEQLTTNPNILGPLEFITYFLEIIALLLIVVLSKNGIKFVRPFKSWQTYIFGALAFGALFIFDLLYSNLVVPENIGDNQNQQLVIDITKAFPVLSIIVFGVVGPVCEELTYRVGLFGFLRRWNRVAAYIIGALFFAFIHFSLESVLKIVAEGTMEYFIIELWNIPAYIVCGFVLVATYDLFGFGASTVAHILNNVIGVIQILVLARYGR